MALLCNVCEVWGGNVRLLYKLYRGMANVTFNMFVIGPICSNNFIYTIKHCWLNVGNVKIKSKIAIFFGYF